MPEWIAHLIDGISTFAPGKYLGIGIGLIAVALGWALSDDPNALLAALGTGVLSLGAFTQSLDASKSVAILAAIWSAYFTIPHWELVTTRVDPLINVNECFSQPATSDLKDCTDDFLQSQESD